MKRLIFLFFMAFLAAPTSAQDGDDVTIPENYLLKKAEHYKEYEPTVVNCAKWIINNKIDHMPNRRVKAYTFIWDWIEGHPEITWNINKNLVSTSANNADLFFVFMCGFVLDAIENEDKSDFTSQMAGVVAMLNCYNDNRAKFSKDKLCEKLLKMKSKNTLNDHVKKNA
jgi:hypothetical protein